MNRLTSFLTCAVFACIFTLTSLSTTQATVMYSLDDGSSEFASGTTLPSDIMWLNSFTVQLGGEVITSISLPWGSPALAGGSGVAVGDPATVLLYNDPNNDGNPSDAIFLTSAPTTVQLPDTDTFITVPITPTEVNNVFFVAALMTVTGFPPAPASADESSAEGRSWWVASAPGAFNISNLSANELLCKIGDPGCSTAFNWMIRANGESAVIPEPSMFLLLGGGLLGVFAFRRKFR